MKKVTGRSIFLAMILVTLMSCVYGQSITPVKDNLYCISAVFDLTSDINPEMTKLARQCCPAGYKIVSQTQNMNPYGEYVVMWHISCEEDKEWKKGENSGNGYNKGDSKPD